MTDLEIYIDGFNDKGIQIANAFLDVMRYKLNELGADSTDAFTKIFDTSHIETEQYYLNILLEDLKPIVSDLRNTHMKDSNTASDIDYQSMVKNIIDDFTSPTQIATEDTPSSRTGNCKTVFHRAARNIGNRGFSIGKSAATVRAERNNRLAGQVIAFKEMINYHWHIAPPVGIADKNRVIVIHVVHSTGNLRAGIVRHFLPGYIQQLAV